jgi:hypothetical protein
MDIPLSSKHRRILQGQAIGEDEPGRVLRDFETLLGFVGEHGIRVSGVHQVLPMNLLAELNARLSKPLRRGDAEIIGEHDPLGSLFKCSTFMQRIPDRGLKVAGDRQSEQFTIPYSVGAYNLALLELFGCAAIEEGLPEEGKGWVVARVRRTPFGEALIKLLSQHKLAALKRSHPPKDRLERGTRISPHL